MAAWAGDGLSALEDQANDPDLAESVPWNAMIGPAAGIIIVASLARPVGACPPPTDVRIEVVARQDPLGIVSDIGLSDMEELRRRSGQQERHRTLGFYSSTLATKIEPKRATSRSDGCEPMIRATVDLWLTERRIHIAREAANLPCLSGVAVSHLTHHAAAEGEAFERLVARIGSHLHSATFSATAMEERARGGDVDLLIKAAVDQELAIYDADRKRMRDKTDTADEIETVQNACS